METDLASRLGRNIQQLRKSRGLTQVQLAQTSGVPRATCAHLESGGANPTLSVLRRIADALQVSLDELTATPRAGCRVYPKGTLPVRRQGLATVHKLLPDPLTGMEIDRIELPPDGRLVGVPHTPGTREYLTCEKGQMVLVAAGERFELAAGDVVAFNGDQRHSYLNLTGQPAIGFSVVVLAGPAAPSGRPPGSPR